MTSNVPALISDIRPATMPIYEKFAATGILEVRRHWETDAIRWDVQVRDDRLIPLPSCRAILAEIEAANVPAPKPVATRLVKLLLGAWPARDMHDPEIFASVLNLTFASYPGDVGLAAVDALTRASKWLPTRADLIEALDEAMLPRSYAAHVVKAHLQRHAEIDRERAARETRMEERRQRYVREPWLWLDDQFGAKLGCAGNYDMHAWLKTACNEFGVREVEAWLADLVPGTSSSNKGWYRVQQALCERAAAARQDRQP